MTTEHQTELLEEAQNLLDEHFPSPDLILNQLARIVAYAPDTLEYVEVRQLTLEIDDLVAQIRWHLGQAILLRRQYPKLIGLEREEADDFTKLGFPASVPLLLRPYVSGIERVVFGDLSENYKGMPAAGWVFHMLIDSALYRCVALLDRLARLLFKLYELPIERVYFRSRYMKRLNERASSERSAELLGLSESGEYNLLLWYRDGYSHERRFNSEVSGGPISYMITESSGTEFLPSHCWKPEDLMALGKASYTVVERALASSVSLIEQKIKPSGEVEI